MRGEVLKGHLDLLLLSALVPGPAHGYSIIARIKTRSAGAFELAEGTVYPALRRLEQAGLLESEWSDDAARRRRIYRLTRKGRKAVAERKSEWSEFVDAMSLALGKAT
jgi:PadR family transcriptional regulator, regulatory protein PadR